MGKLTTILKWTGVGVFLTLGATLIFFSLPFTGWKALSVQTGSMEPAIRQGSLVFVQSVPPDSLQPGDVLTYKSADKPETITHRVVARKGLENGPKQYITKGDANKSPDVPVSQGQVVGKVAYALPVAGRALDFIKTPVGLALFVYIPAAILFIYEIRLLVKRLAKLEIEKQQRATLKVLAMPPPMPQSSPTKSITIKVVEPNKLEGPTPEPTKRPGIVDGLGVLLVGVLIASTVGTTQAALTSTAALTGNTISSTGSVTPPPEPPQTDRVLIWRVNFPGAPNADTSFQPIIYLYNPVAGTVPDLEGWRLESSSGLVFGFRGPTPLYPRNRFFDVHSGPSGKLLTTGDFLVLKDKAGNVVDAISWGTDTSKLSPSIQGITTRKDILRNDPAVDTNTAADWKIQSE
jgi:signal peptidase I